MLHGAEELFFVRVAGYVGLRSTIVVAGLDEAHEERVGLEWLRLELRVELTAEEVRVIGDLDDLDVSPIGCSSGDPKSGAREQRFVLAIELIAVTMAFADLRLAVSGLRHGIRLQLAGPRAQA